MTSISSQVPTTAIQQAQTQDANNDDDLEKVSHLLRMLPEDTVLQIFDMTNFPLHRYAHLSTMDNRQVKFNRMIRVLYGYFPYSSLGHRKIHLIFRNFTLYANQCMSHRGQIMKTISDNDTRILELIPVSPSIFGFSVLSNLFFQDQSLNTHQCEYLLSRLTGLRKLEFVYQKEINHEILPLLQKYSTKLEYLNLFGTSVTLDTIAQFLLTQEFLPELKTLKVNEPLIADDNAILLPGSIKKRPLLRHLELEGQSSVFTSVVQQLLENEHLRVLHLTKAPITPDALQRLTKNKSITELNVSGCKFLDGACIQYLANNTHLKRLTVDATIQNIDDLLFSPKSKVEHLTVLGADTGQMIAISDNHSLSQKLPKERRNRFKSLNFNFNTTIQAPLISHIVRNHRDSLEQLELRYCSLSLSACEPLFSVESFLSHLNHIDVSLNEQLSNEFAQQLVQSASRMPRLISLDASKTKITEQGAIVLSQHPTIQSLRLDNNIIGDNGARALFQSNRLAHLSLMKCNITDGSLMVDSDRTSFDYARNKLIKLEMMSNGITSKGLRLILPLVHLRTLDLTSNMLNDDCVEDIISLSTSTSNLCSLYIKRNRFKKGQSTLITKAKHIATLIID